MPPKIVDGLVNTFSYFLKCNKLGQSLTVYMHFQKNVHRSGLTHYSRCCFFIPPENIRKVLDFLTFSGGIEKQHRAVNGLKTNKTFLNFRHIFS